LAFFSAAAFSCGVAIEEEPVDVIIISSAFLNEIGGVGGSRAVWKNDVDPAGACMWDCVNGAGFLGKARC
jgi:hypothetical protein